MSQKSPEAEKISEANDLTKQNNMPCPIDIAATIQKQGKLQSIRFEI